MRFLAAIGFFLCALLCLIWGVLLVLGSKYEEFKAETAGGDLTVVSGDLVDNPEQLRQMQRATEARSSKAGRRPLVSGIIILGLVPPLIVGGILTLLRRAKKLRLGLDALGAVALIGLMLWNGFLPLGAVALGASAVALLLTVLTKSHAT